MASDNPVPSDASVSFSVKELIGRVDGKLDILLAKIDKKASHDHLERLETRTEAALVLIELRVNALETEGTASRAVSTTTRWLLFTAIPAAAGVTAVAMSLIK